MQKVINKKKCSVLIVDDDEIIRSTLVGMLCKDFDCFYVENGVEAIEYCQRCGQPDAIIMDYLMPGYSGVETCSKIRELDELSHIPIIFLTGNDDVELQQKCWQAGAADFLSKPVRAKELKMRLEHQIMVREREQFLERLACKDTLTTLYNRQFLVQNAPRIVRQLNRSKDQLSLLMIDIDNFKHYNDAYGHLEGDKVLKSVAQSLSDVVKRPLDYVLRFGGEEFVALLPKTDREGAMTIARKMNKAVERLSIVNKKSELGRVTVSIGVSTSVVNKKIKFVDLLKKADVAMYKAKSRGKNTAVLHGEGEQYGKVLQMNASSLYVG